MRQVEATYIIRNKEEPIPSQLWNPHYSDRYFTDKSGGRTIFLAPGLVTVEEYGVDKVDGLEYNYSDRIAQWVGHEAMDRATKTACAVLGSEAVTAHYYEIMLQNAYQNPQVELQHIIAGVNLDSGYSFRIFGTVGGFSQEQ